MRTTLAGDVSGEAADRDRRGIGHVLLGDCPFEADEETRIGLGFDDVLRDHAKPRLVPAKRLVLNARDRRAEILVPTIHARLDTDAQVLCGTRDRRDQGDGDE